MIRAFIFDIDGTLVDSVDFHARTWQKAFRRFGHDIPYDAVRSQIGKGGDQLLPAFLSKPQVEREGQKIADYKGDLYRRDYLPRVRAFPKVRELFQRIRGDGRRVALASSSEGDELERYKRIMNAADLVDVSTSADDAEKTKPHPDIFAAALEKLELPPAEAIVVGDSPYDAEASGKIGLQSWGVLCGGFAEGDLRAAGFARIYRDPADLLERYGAAFTAPGPAA